MKLLRRAHLFLGCFFTPLLLFYILTGWYQTVNPNRLKHPSEAETLLQKFRVVHSDQIYPAEQEFEKPASPKLFKALVVVMSIAATLTIALGLVLSFKMFKPVWPVWLCLALGILLPMLMLWLGQKR
jgi:ABC-type sugar transport system permease subunit